MHVSRLFYLGTSKETPAVSFAQKIMRGYSTNPATKVFAELFSKSDPILTQGNFQKVLPQKATILLFKPMNKSGDIRRANVAANYLIPVNKHVCIYLTLVIRIISNLKGIAGDLFFLVL